MRGAGRGGGVGHQRRLFPAPSTRPRRPQMWRAAPGLRLGCCMLQTEAVSRRVGTAGPHAAALLSAHVPSRHAHPRLNRGGSGARRWGPIHLGSGGGGGACSGGANAAKLPGRAGALHRRGATHRQPLRCAHGLGAARQPGSGGAAAEQEAAEEAQGAAGAAAAADGRPCGSQRAGLRRRQRQRQRGSISHGQPTGASHRPGSSSPCHRCPCCRRRRPGRKLQCPLAGCRRVDAGSAGSKSPPGIHPCWPRFGGGGGSGGSGSRRAHAPGGAAAAESENQHRSQHAGQAGGLPLP